MRRASTKWNSLRLAPRVAIVLLGVGFVALFVVFVLKWAPQLLATDGLTGKEKAEEIGRARTGVLAALAGLIAIAGAVFTGLSYRLNRAGQITERFTRAIDQLGSSDLDVQLGGIYALERIARDSRNDHPQIVEILTAYVREHARRYPISSEASMPGRSIPRTHDPRIEAIRALEAVAKGLEIETDADSAHPSDDQKQSATIRTDVQAVMSVLGRRDASQDRAGAHLDLVNTELRGAILSEANLVDADLSEANLVDADLSRANLQSVNLRRATVQSVNLSEANLQHANLYRADLQHTNLARANLQHANLARANLQHANLARANLQHAILYRANLQYADLSETDLQHANLARANLQEKPPVSETSIDRLSGANLRGVVYDDATKWPTGFDPREHGALLLAETDDEAGSVPSTE